MPIESFGQNPKTAESFLRSSSQRNNKQSVESNLALPVLEKNEVRLEAQPTLVVPPKKSQKLQVHFYKDGMKNIQMRFKSIAGEQDPHKYGLNAMAQRNFLAKYAHSKKRSIAQLLGQEPVIIKKKRDKAKEKPITNEYQIKQSKLTLLNHFVYSKKFHLKKQKLFPVQRPQFQKNYGNSKWDYSA